MKRYGKLNLLRITYLMVIILLFSFSSCRHSNKENVEMEENREAKAMLQGIWLEDETDDPKLRVSGDTIYYADRSVAPVYFKIFGDSLVTYGGVTNEYKIEKQTPYVFCFHTLSGEEIHLHKAENEVDLSDFLHKGTVPIYEEVIKKDSVVWYDNHRYHGYVYINPSEIKIVKPGLTGDGVIVDNVYYDNIIHICVYEGKQSLFAKDITKQMFANLIPSDFFKYAVLSNMDFGWVDVKGYHFQANLCIPDEASCYLVNLTVDKNGKIDYKLVQ